jgi:hypothetical protein
MYIKKKVHINGSPFRYLKSLCFGENKIQILKKHLRTYENKGQFREHKSPIL